jgi:hypothetical protein
LALAATVLVGLSAAAFSQMQTSQKPEGIVVGDSVSVTTTVESIDKKDRVLALRGPAGDLRIVEVDEGVRNGNKIKVGDRIKAEYYEAVAVYFGKPGEQPEEDAAAIFTTATHGKKPGIFAVGAVDESVSVEAIDWAKRTVTVTGPSGYAYTVKVDDTNSEFEQLKVGDSIHLRYIEAIAIVVEKP